MKKIFKYMAIVAMGAVMASCNKAEYKTANFVSFDSGRAMMPEACGIYAIPVSLYNADAAIVTYMITDGTAKGGDDFVIVDKDGNPDPTGVLNLKKGNENFIYVKVTDRTGELTKNLNFTIDLVAAATDGVVLGATNSCACTIIDADAGINLLLGSWSGTGKNSDGADIDMSFTLDVLDDSDPAAAEVLEVFPDCNVVLSNIQSKYPAGDVWYANFNENTSVLTIYAGQYYQTFNFGDFVSDVHIAGGRPDEDVTFAIGDGTMELENEINFWIDYPGYTNYTISGVNYDELTLKKLE